MRRTRRTKTSKNKKNKYKNDFLPMHNADVLVCRSWAIAAIDARCASIVTCTAYMLQYYGAPIYGIIQNVSQ
jgi:hypothetical protein